MRRMQLARARRPETLARVVRRPDVEIANLRALRSAEAYDRARGYAPGQAGARWDKALAQKGARSGDDTGVEGVIGTQDTAWRWQISRLRRLVHGRIDCMYNIMLLLSTGSEVTGGPPLRYSYEKKRSAMISWVPRALASVFTES